MKTQFLTAQKTLLLSSAILFSIIGCKKETITTNQQAVIRSSVESDDLSINWFINKLAGTYSAAGTRTLYIGDASDSVVNLIIDLSANSPKTITATNSTTLVCDYADEGYGGGLPLGWQYVITFYPAKKTFDVQPNDIMASQIEPGSWIVYEKRFNPRKREFYFKTGNSNFSSGYDRIVEETLTWQSK